MRRVKRIFVSALELSSNFHLRSLMRFMPDDVLVCGVCDGDIGLAFYDPSEFNTMGFLDVLVKARFFRTAMRALSREASMCDRVLLMDSSSFHLRLAKMIRRRNSSIEIMYYILPQVWAWKAWRAREVVGLCQKIACILPFELCHYSGGNARYVGHPLLDVYGPDHRCVPDSGVFVFMPGSRRSEISNLMGIFREVRQRLLSMNPHARFRLVVPPHFRRDIECGSSLYGDVGGFDVLYNVKDGLGNSGFAFVCSGTATLEACLMGVPFLLVYRTNAIDYAIARMFVRLKYIGLANILFQAYLDSEEGSVSGVRIGCGARVLHEELLQGDCNVDNIIRKYEGFDYTSYEENSECVRSYLKHGSAEEVVNWLLD